LRASIQSTVRASDNSGIAATTIVVDNASSVSNLTRACDYTQPVPCTQELGARHQVDLTWIADGTHSIDASATDAAGNVAKTAPQTIHVDNHAPDAPTGIAVAGGDGWRQTNAFDVTWTNPDQGAASPVAKVHYRLCGPGGCQAEQVVDGAEALRSLSVPGTGDWALSVWLEDAAGNVDPAKAAVVHLRYGTDPAAGSGASSSLAAAGLRVRWVVRRGRRLTVRGVVARGAGGHVVVRVRSAAKGATRPRVARRVKLRSGHPLWTVAIRLPAALAHARRLRIAISYGGDAAHRRSAVVRIVRPLAHAPR
jgi:hypothetical protein